MCAKVAIAEAVAAIIGLLLVALAGAGLLPDYSFTLGWLIIIVSLVLIGVGEGPAFSLKPKYKFLFAPIIWTILWNLGIVYFFITMDKQLFEVFVNDFGLTGSWNLFTLNMHAEINGVTKTYPYINGTLCIFLLCVIGNIALSAFYLSRLYRAKENPTSPSIG